MRESLCTFQFSERTDATVKESIESGGGARPIAYAGFIYRIRVKKSLIALQVFSMQCAKLSCAHLL